ncbi:hypothetical protein E3N88_21339 [Mikania micrantha]|uniref:Uncharacterized protein n=1 Tax=Mikania micrantha TaxID=192012 RepID=A0A5N6NJG7_9ASTR|nr:hypothetical protein E3N88_21339 [Mikania micrantha]
MSMEPVIVNGDSNLSNGHAKKPCRIFVGYDPREDVAYEVCRYSILKRSSIPVEIIPIKQSELRKKNYYWRDRGKLESTEFSFTRFLTPFLGGYEGWAMFVDCDFLYLGDIKELFDLVDQKFAVMFQWLEDHEIGSVPFVWNFLVGHNRVLKDDPSTYPKAIHYTLGGPWFEAWKDCEFGDLWLNELECKVDKDNKME